MDNNYKYCEIMDEDDLPRKKVKLNLGSGSKLKENYINIDIREISGIDKVIDLEKDLLKEFENNSVDKIYSSHFLEHIKPDVFLDFLNDMYRVSKKGAVWEFVLPFDNAGGRCDVEHYRTFYYNSFKHYHYGRELKSVREIQLIKLHTEPNRFIKMLYQVFPFLCSEIHFKFEVVKE